MTRKAEEILAEGGRCPFCPVCEGTKHLPIGDTGETVTCWKCGGHGTLPLWMKSPPTEVLCWRCGEEPEADGLGCARWLATLVFVFIAGAVAVWAVVSAWR